MSGIAQYLRKPALLVILVVIVGLGAASAMAALTASSAPKPFELIFDGGYELDDDGVMRSSGAFTSKAPFCESGSAVDLWTEFLLGLRFACADGSGSLTLEFTEGGWRILEGTGQYAGLRGKGTAWHAGDWWDLGPFRSTFEGVVAEDAVAPTIALPSAKASKVKGTKSVYTIPVTLDIRDDVEDNPVSYKVIVMRESGSGPWLASKSGQATGAISFELRVRRPNGRLRPLLVRATATDPVGNTSALEVTVTLPR